MNGDPFSVGELRWRREMLYRVLGREVKVPGSRGQRNVMLHVRLKSGDLARYAAPLVITIATILYKVHSCL